MAYVVEKRGISRAVVERFRLGFCNRTLGLRLPEKNRAAGAEVRARLENLGVFRSTGHEHFRGCITVPIVDGGAVRGVYGRKIDDGSKPHHLYLPGPHRGVFNADGLAGAKEVVLCESLIDALTFISAGLVNVTTSYGVDGFIDELLSAFKTHQVARVVIAYDADSAGDVAAVKLAERLHAEGISTTRALFPRGLDANSYAQKATPPEKSLRLVVQNAAPIQRERATASTPPSLPSTREEQPAAEREVTDTPSAAELPSATPAAPGAPPLLTSVLPLNVDGDEAAVSIGDRRYRIRGLAKNTALDVLKLNLMATRGEAFHVDTLDLYAAKQRAAFIAAAAHELRTGTDIIKSDVGRLLRSLEIHQAERVRSLLTPQTVVVELTEEQRAEAFSLLRDPLLLDRVLEDFERCGVVGEKTNKLVGYLAAISRKLDDPLAIIIQSSSAAGKSSLMEAVLAFVPDEDKVKYSAMTGQSLFYMAGKDLRQKVLAVVEEEGAERASYALKLLQSEKELTIASTGKDPASGKMVTHEYRVEGPVMIFLTTTAAELDEELLNRCLVLTVDEDRTQTRAIHVLQRRRQTLEGLLVREDRSRIIELHKNAQRLLRSVLVANPFAEQLTFLDDKTRTRRDHMKYLNLIRAIALLHQHQRPTRTVERDGVTMEYIEATIEDISTANRLCHEVLGRSLDELPPQTRRLLSLLDEMVSGIEREQGLARTDVRISRRAVREFSGWGNTQLKVHLGRLEDMELVATHQDPHHPQRRLYELVFDHSGGGDHSAPQMQGLIDVRKLQESHDYDGNRSGQTGHRSGPGRREVGPRSVDGRAIVVDDKASKSTKTEHGGVRNDGIVESDVSEAAE
jgi:hypothetical protein